MVFWARIRHNTGAPIDGLDLPHIDFIKIDVEFAELQVLEGAQGLIKRDKPAVLVECHNTKKLTGRPRPGGRAS